MKIARMIKANDGVSLLVTFELTHDELVEAYLQREHELEVADAKLYVEARLNGFMPHPQIEALIDSTSILEDVAREAHDLISSDYTHNNAFYKATNVVLHKKEVL